MLKKIVIFACLTGVWLFVASVPVQAGVAYSPKKTRCVIWEPFAWKAGTSGVQLGNAIENRITGAKKQGYTVDRYYDDGPTGPGSGADSDFEGCSRTNWDGMPTNTGIFVVSTHGNSSLIDVCTNIHQDLILDSTEPYWASWTDPDGDGTADSGMGVIDHFSDWGCYVGYVTATRLGNWEGTLGGNRAIVCLCACKSAMGASSPLYKLNGRVGFGYSDSPASFATMVSDMTRLFDHMNGSEPAAAKGTKRRAGDAYDAGGYSTYFTQYPTDATADDTTLCPSVDNTVIDPSPGTPFAEGSGAGDAGTGYVEFDTHCDNSVAATSALTYTKTGTVDVGGFEWDTDYKISFCYDDGESGYTVNLRAQGDAGSSKVKAKDGGQHLDGGNSTQDGVAPNEHDYTWSFSY